MALSLSGLKPGRVPGTEATPPSRRTTLEQRIRAQAYALGFDLAGIATLGVPGTVAHFDEWLAAGYEGEMSYLARGAEKRRDARLPVSGARSAIVVALDYGAREPGGPVARYARGADYHDVMLAKLRELHRWLDAEIGRPVAGKAHVDTGPLLERDLAQRAGLGWFGKNTMLLNPRLGSFFFLGTLLVELDLTPDTPFEADRCGSCTRCLDACPTQAFVAPRMLDATRCISYLTIELKGAIEETLREAMGEMIYGCDVCQEVCPWNLRFGTPLENQDFAPRDLLRGRDPRGLAREVLAMDEAGFRAAFRGSPIKRTKLRGLKRNAAVVLGNVGTVDDAPALERALHDAEPLVRDHAHWALERIDGVRRGRSPTPTES